MPAEEPSVWLGPHLNSRRNQVNDTFAREINAEMRTVLQAITASVNDDGDRMPPSSLGEIKSHENSKAGNDCGGRHRRVPVVSPAMGKGKEPLGRSTSLRPASSHGPSISWGNRGDFAISSGSGFPLRDQSLPCFRLSSSRSPLAPMLRACGDGRTVSAPVWFDCGGETVDFKHTTIHYWASAGPWRKRRDRNRLIGIEREEVENSVKTAFGDYPAYSRFPDPSEAQTREGLRNAIAAVA